MGARIGCACCLLFGDFFFVLNHSDVSPGAVMDVTYRFDGFSLDPVRRLMFAADGEPIALKPRVFDTLLYLIEHRGALLEKQTLLDAIWPHVVVEENNLNQAISTLRRVLGESPGDHRFIVTEPGRGYRFVARVDTVPVEPATSSSAGSSTDPTPTLLETMGHRVRGYGLMLGGSALAVVTAVTGAWLWFGSASDADPEALGTLVRDAAITAYAGNELAPALAPDGQSVAFTRDDEDGNSNLHVTRIGTSGSMALTTAPEPDRFPAWSPNGAEIAFLRQIGANAFDLIVMPAVGGRERRT